jgi:hypothetical protein
VNREEIERSFVGTGWGLGGMRILLAAPPARRGRLRSRPPDTSGLRRHLESRLVGFLLRTGERSRSGHRGLGRVPRRKLQVLLDVVGAHP